MSNESIEYRASGFRINLRDTPKLSRFSEVTDIVWGLARGAFEGFLCILYFLPQLRIPLLLLAGLILCFFHLCLHFLDTACETLPCWCLLIQLRLQLFTPLLVCFEKIIELSNLSLDFSNLGTEVLGTTGEDFFVVLNLLLEVLDFFVFSIHSLLEWGHLILFGLVCLLQLLQFLL